MSANQVQSPITPETNDPGDSRAYFEAALKGFDPFNLPHINEDELDQTIYQRQLRAWQRSVSGADRIRAG